MQNENNNIVDVNKALDELSDKDSINSFGVDDINRHIYTLKVLEFYNYHKVVTILDRWYVFMYYPICRKDI